MSKRTGTFIGVSLVAHAALLGAIGVPRANVAVPRPPVDFEVVSVPAPSAPRVAEIVAPSARREVTDPRSVQRHRPERAAPRRQRAPRRPAVRRPPTPMRLGMRSGLDALALDELPEELAVRSASPRAERRAKRAPAPVDDATAIKRRLDDVLAEDAAVRDVADGRVHPHVFDVMHTADKLFTPTWRIVENDPDGIGTMARATKDFARELVAGYKKSLQAYVEAGRGLGRKPGGAQPHDAMGAAWRTAEKSAGTLSCDLCVTIRIGEPPRIIVRRTSGRRALDRLARKALARALRLEQQPGDAPDVKACYRFDAKFHRIPPLPIVGGAFDESELWVEFYYPGKKIIRTNIRLLTARRLVAKKGP